jgi:uncharacterized protein YbjT (DUF2867 family)
MILVTGAAGKTGKAILKKLAEQGQPVRALVFRSGQMPEVEALGAKEAIVGDMRDSNFIRSAVRGVKAVYHICPNVNPDEIVIGQEIIEAAAVAGIAHFVYHSVLHPQIEAMPHHWKKMRVEERLFESGMAFTILQPAAYMQNLLVNLKDIFETGRFTVPYAVTSRISMVDLEDVASAAAIILSEDHLVDDQPIHQNATYELVGTPPMTQTEVAETLSRELKRPVIAESVSIESWEHKARKSGMGDYQVKTLIRMFRYYEEFGFSGNPHVLSWLLGRPATSFDTFIKRAAKDYSHAAL